MNAQTEFAINDLTKLEADLFVVDRAELVFDEEDLMATYTVHCSLLAPYSPDTFDEETEVVLAAIPGCCGTNFSDDVTHANHLALNVEHEDCGYYYEQDGAHGTFGALFRLEYMSAGQQAKLVKTCRELREYPVLDEEALWQVQQEWLDDAWQEWLGDDFAKQLEEVLGGRLEIFGPSWYEDAKRNPLRKLFDDNRDWHELVYESGGVTVLWDMDDLEPGRLTDDPTFRKLQVEAYDG